MKRRRPQWQSSCTMLTLLLSGIAMYASGQAYEGRALQTVPPILQPIPPPNEVNVTSVPTVSPSQAPICGDGCSPPTGGEGGEQVPPTFAPSEDFFTPSMDMVEQPIEPTQPAESQTPQPVDRQPIEPQTPQPVVPQTPQPIEPQTPQPVEPQTPQPVEPQTPQPVEPQTPQPVEPQTPQPVEPQTPQPVEPQTPQPFEPQTPQPAFAPVEVTAPPIEPTPEPPSPGSQTATPTQTPTVEAAEPTSRTPIQLPTLFQLTDPPTSRVEQVPITPFVLTLGFDEQQTGTAQDLEVLTSEMERIVSDYLFDSLSAQITEEGVTLENVDLTVTPQLRRRRRADNVFDDEPQLLRRGSDNVFDGRHQRQLQAETVNFDVTGNVVYTLAGDSDVTQEQLAKETNQAVATTMNDPQTQQDLTEEFQSNTESEALSNTSAVSAQVQEPPSDGGSDKPTTIATVFGFILVGLGALGIGMYGWTFIKKKRKRARQRKLERQRGLGDSYNNAANTTASMGSMNSSINQSRSTPNSKVMVLPPTEFEEDSSSSSAYESESSSEASASAGGSSAAAMDSAPVTASDSVSSSSDPYAGIASVSDGSSKSEFTRELELAASLDRRSWIETQRQRSTMEQSRAVPEGSIQYPSQYAVEGTGVPQEVSGGGGAAAGIAAAGVATAGLAAVAVASYPYGDEKEDSDEVPVDLDEVQNSDDEDLFNEVQNSDDEDLFKDVQNSDDEDLFNDDEDGIEWTAEGVWSPYDGYAKREAPAEKSISMSSLSDSRMTDSRSGTQKDRAGWLKSWSSIDSIRRSRRSEPNNPNAFMTSWSSIDSAREAKSRSTMLGSMDEDTEPKEQEVFVHASVRAVEVDTVESRARMSPTVSSAGTSNAVRTSPPASTATEEVVVTEKAIIEEHQDDADSVLTEDIVKEVSRLARFVKKYDRKKEKKLLKDREREEKAALAIKDSQSFPSVGYDAMSDSISALRKGTVEASPRRERTALAKPVEEESNGSERSWSTTSNANAPLDDDEDSDPVLDDSEIDVSDDSSVEEAPSESASDASRLGITPFSVQRVVGVPQAANPAKRSRRVDASAPETSRPPVSQKQNGKKGLPPLPTTPGSPDEDSPEKTHTPVQSVKQALKRVNSARQKKFAKKNMHEQQPPEQTRDVDLTEDALQGLSDGNGPAALASPYQQPKGALAVLRKNEAILDTASSHFSAGVTSSQYEQAFKVGVVAQQQQRKAYLERSSFKLNQRVPQDPPAKTSESASLQATDEKRSPPGWEAKEAAVEMRIPPAQPSLQVQSRARPPPQVQSRPMPAAPQVEEPEERPPWSQPPPPQGTSAMRTSPSQPTQRRASFKPAGFQPQQTRTPSPKSSSSVQSGTKRAAPDSTPLTPVAQETAPAPISPAIRSPPRRKNKKGSAFNSVISMFEQKPKNPIYPVGEGWQHNGASR